MDPIYSINFPEWSDRAVMYHASGIIKWRGMRDHTELLDINAYLTWLLAMCPTHPASTPLSL